MDCHFQVSGRLIFVGGGSKGLGKEISKILARRGANIVIFARGQAALSRAKEEILAERTNSAQTVEAVPVDLTVPEEVDKAFRAYPEIPSILFCVAGGSTVEMGFLANQTTDHIQSSIAKNYYISAFMAWSMIRIWLEDQDAPNHISEGQRRAPTIKEKDFAEKRHIVFTSSAAVFLGIPGYTLYTPAKAAARALADTLRQEMLYHSTASFDYRIHCLFPGNFDSDLFQEEQKYKPTLTKELEGSAGEKDSPNKNAISSAEAAHLALLGLDRGDFAVCFDWQTQFMLGSMRGPTPRRGFGIFDVLLDFIGVVAMTIVRWTFDKRCAAYNTE